MNVLIYVLDSLRADHLSQYGYSRNTSPFIDRLAQDGITFERAYSQATWTRASAGTLLTGLYPEVHGARDMFKGLRSDVPRLPEILQQAGFATAIFSTIAQISPATRFEKGVDHFATLFDGSVLSNSSLFQEQDNYLPSSADIPRSDQLTEDAIRWLSSIDKPFFTLLWSIDTHVPYVLPSEGGEYAKSSTTGQLTGSLQSIREANSATDTQRMLDLYDSVIHTNDQNFGKLVAYLKETGKYDDTLIIVAGDHGEVFNEHSRLSHSKIEPWLKAFDKLPGFSKLLKRFRLVNPYGWLGHVDILPYEEALRIPLIMKLPYNQEAGSFITQEVGLLDIAPTLYDMLNIDAAKKSNIATQGRSLVPLLHDRPTSFDNRYLFSDSCTGPEGTRYLSIQNQEWKLVRLMNPDEMPPRSATNLVRTIFNKLERMSGKELLFRRFHEGVNLTSEYPQVAQTLAEELEQWIQNCKDRTKDLEGSTVQLDHQIEARLRELGYL